MEQEQNKDENTQANKYSASKRYTGVYLSNIVAVPNVNITCEIGNPEELNNIRLAHERGDQVVLLSSRDGKLNPSVEDFFEVGCLCTIKKFEVENDHTKVLLFGECRMLVTKIEALVPEFVLYAQELAEINTNTAEAYQKMKALKDELHQLNSRARFLPVMLENQLNNESSPDVFSDVLIHLMAKDDISTQQKLLAIQNVEERLSIEQELAKGLKDIIALRKKIDDKVNENLSQTQKEIYLREQLNVINQELNGDVDEIEEYRKKVKALNLPKESEEKVLKEVNRLSKMPFGSPELGYIRNFLDTVLALPWHKETEDKLDIVEARKILDDDHYALDKVKERILETLSVISLTHNVNAQIICLVGAPGVGKTSVAESIAKAMGRKFVQVSLGGVNDESVIRGHRRTYVGAMPGRIIEGMKQAGTVNPVFLLDEIDKLTSDVRGDPASALLEVLDPAQNSHFKDNFLEIPYDLSKVMFILTANTLQTIPRPLLDRMEIIEVSGYTPLEKIEIAKRHLIVKQEKLAGLPEGTVPFSDELLTKIIEDYTSEAGVRGLERQIASICRKYAMFKVSGKMFEGVSVNNLKDFLGNDYVLQDEFFDGGKVGEVVGLAVNYTGGKTILIEVNATYGSEKMILTGQMGKVSQESARTAYTLVQSMADKLGIDPYTFRKTTLHIHYPHLAGGVEGPSAGVATAFGIASVLTNRPVREKIAMTGEVSLHGRVLAIGGVRDKIMGAARAGMKTVLLPKSNEHNLDDVPKEVLDKLEIKLVSDISEVFEYALLPPLDEPSSLMKFVKRDLDEMNAKKKSNEDNKKEPV